MTFDDMVVVLFADSMLSQAATWHPQGGGEYPVRAMAKRPDVITGFGEGSIHSSTALFDVQAKDVPLPAVGDKLTVDGITYVVQSAPVADCERLVWTLNVRPE